MSRVGLACPRHTSTFPPYDAWNRQVKVTGQDEDLVIQSSAYDALGRRVKKVVTNSGDLDGTTVYYYRGHQSNGVAPAFNR